MKRNYLIPILVAILALIVTKSSQAQIMENFDEWRAKEIQADLKQRKHWGWALKVPSVDHFPTFTVKVNGTKHEAVKFQEVSYLDIPYAKKFDIEISANISLKSVDISPHSYGTKSELNSNCLRFSLDRPRKLIITFNGTHRLLLFTNGPETHGIKPDGANVIRLSDYKVDSTGKKNETVAIQKAIDDTSKVKGTLYISPGTYCVDQLWMKSNTTIYLERGATLLMSSEVEEHKKIIEKNLELGLQRIAPVMIYKVHDVRLCGFGTIDGNGEKMAQMVDFDGRGRYRLVHSVDAKNIEIRDLILKNAQRWNTHLANTDNILIENVKIINSINICNTDAIDPDNARNVLIRDVFTYSSDDSVVIKTSARWHDEKRKESEFIKSANITTRDCVFWTCANALKIGTETFRDIDNVLFENNDILYAYSPVTIEIKEGSKTSNVRFINNRVEKIGSKTSGRAIHILVRNYIYTSHKATMIERPSYGQLTNVLIKDLALEQDAKRYSTISGFNETSFVRDIVLDNVTIKGVKITNAEELNLKVGKFVEGLKFQ